MDLLKKKDFQEWDRDFTGLDLITDLHLFAPLIFLFVLLADIFSFPSQNKASEFQNRAINHPGDKTKKQKSTYYDTSSLLPVLAILVKHTTGLLQSNAWHFFI
jgi:hypothetical protein